MNGQQVVRFVAAVVLIAGGGGSIGRCWAARGAHVGCIWASRRPAGLGGLWFKKGTSTSISAEVAILRNLRSRRPKPAACLLAGLVAATRGRAVLKQARYAGPKGRRTRTGTQSPPKENQTKEFPADGGRFSRCSCNLPGCCRRQPRRAPSRPTTPGSNATVRLSHRY